MSAMNSTQLLLSDVEAFLAETGMEASTLGQKSVRDWKVVRRLREGGSVTLRNADRLREFMEKHRRSRSAELAV